MSWWEEWRGFVAIMSGIILAAVLLVWVLLAVAFYFDRQGCERTSEVQGVATEYHWTTGCIYVDPDYVVAN